MMLRDASELLYPAVCATLASLGIDTRDGTQDAAAAKLAQQYARTIDDAPDGKAYASAIRWIGPELLKVLESLGATPAARAAISKGAAKDTGPARENKLAKLRSVSSHKPA
jgi:hypothetical protein